MIEFIEDLICDVTQNNPSLLPATELRIFKSLRKQFQKQLALTERQYDLVLKKIKKHHAGFQEKYSDVDEIVKHVKFPFREIDRSRWIKITNGLLGTETYPYITVRALYSKSLMRAFDDIAKTQNCQFFADHATKKRHYRYSESALVYIVDRLTGMHFEIDPLVKETYDRIKLFDATDYRPMLKNGKLHNLPQKSIDQITDELGPINNTNLIRYMDRSLLYGIRVLDKPDYSNISTLTRRIACRKSASIHINPMKVSISEISDTLVSLERLPVLYVVNKRNVVEQVRDAIESFSKHISINEISVCMGGAWFASPTGIPSIMKQYAVMDNIQTNTKLVIITSSTVSPYLPSLHWSPKCVIISENTKILQTSKIVSLYNYVDCVIGYTGKLQNQLSSVLRSHHNEVDII